MKRIRLNVIALILVVGGFVYSAFHVIRTQHFGSMEGVEERNVLRLAHWQLEPGFREGLQWAIDRYHELPHVQESGIRVRQTPIPEKIYNQFMNVHLISGTAPDLAVKGQTRLIQGNHAARFYANLSDYIEEPNPYNERLSLPEDHPGFPEENWEEMAWRETMADGMRSGFDPVLEDFYAVPISTPGPLRLFYNQTLLVEVKAFLREAMEAEREPDWLAAMWIHEEGGRVAGYLPRLPLEDPWLHDETAPPSLGRLFLYCEAVRQYAEATGQPLLVPISASNYGPSNLPNLYRSLFLSAFVEEADLETGSGVSPFEAVIGWESEAWSFASPEMQEYFRFAQAIAQYFPTGFQGLGREQAQRRFVLGNAAIISSGGWDASGIFLGARSRDAEEDRFEVLVAKAPLAEPGERWGAFMKDPISEAALSAGVPVAVNKQSEHFEMAIDFLRFITSLSINEGMNQRTGWLPSVEGARPQEKMEPFMPEPEGIPGNFALNFNHSKASIRNVWLGQSKLVMSGAISYETFAERMRSTLGDERQGVYGNWISEKQRLADQSRALDRSYAVMALQALRGEGMDAEQQSSLLYRSLLHDEGISVEGMWKRLHGDKPFPSFER